MGGIFLQARLLKQLLSLLLSFQLAFASALMQAHAATPDQPEGQEDPLQEIAKDPQARARLGKVELIASKIDDGSIKDIPPEYFDKFNLTKQRFEILDKSGAVKHSYSLINPPLDIPVIAYSNIKPIWKAETSELVFEATIGENHKGELGIPVARMVIPLFEPDPVERTIKPTEIIAQLRDKEILKLVDVNGKQLAFDLGLVTEAFGKMIVPKVTTFVPKESMNLRSETVSMEFITPATKPVVELWNDKSILVPQKAVADANGQPEMVPDISLGDTLIMIGSGASQRPLGVFKRSTDYFWIEKTSAFLVEMVERSNPTPEMIRSTREVVESINEVELAIQEEFARPESTKSLQVAVGRIKPHEVQWLQNAANRASEGQGRDTSQLYSFEQWVAWYNEVHLNAAQALQNEKASFLSAELRKLEKEKKRSLLDTERLELETRAEQNFSNSEQRARADWSQYVEPIKADSPLASKIGKRNPLLRFLHGDEERVEKRILYLFLAATAVYIAPAGVDYLMPEWGIRANLWWWSTYADILTYPSHLTATLTHLIAVVLVVPLAPYISSAFGKTISLLGRAFENSTGKKAAFVRDFAKTWGQEAMEPWQRISTAGMRFMSFFVESYFRHTMQHILRQPGVLMAWENGLGFTTPFKWVKANSELGRAAGLEKSTFVGLANPVKSGDSGLKLKSIADIRSQKEKVQTLIKMQQEENRKLASILAVLAVSDRSSVDPASLLSFASGELSISDLENITKDAEKQRIFELIANETNASIAKLRMIGIGQRYQDIDPLLIARHYDSLMAAANAIKASPNWKLTQKQNFLLFKRYSAEIGLRFTNFGKSTAKFFRTMVISSYLAGQVRRELFTDNTIEAVLPATVGERASLKDPSQAFSDPDGFLGGSIPRWYDTVRNWWAHFFQSGGALALYAMQPKPKSETNYLPYEANKFRSVEREQGFATAAKEFTGGLMNPLESDLGGSMWKMFLKRFTTIQVGATALVAFQYLFIGAPPTEAMLKYFYFFAAAYWTFGIPWDISRFGNLMVGQRQESVFKQMQHGKLLISKGLTEPDHRLALRYLEEGSEIIRRLYHEHRPDVLKWQNGFISNYHKQDPELDLRQLGVAGKGYFGLVAGLAVSVQKGDEASIQKNRRALISLLQRNNSYDTLELARLDSEHLLKLAVAEAPAYTKSNALIQLLSTLVIAAGGSTILAIPMSVVLTKPGAVTMASTVEWWVTSLALYGVFYTFLGKKTWEGLLTNERFVSWYKNATQYEGIFSLALSLPFIVGKTQHLSSYDFSTALGGGLGLAALVTYAMPEGKELLVQVADKISAKWQYLFGAKKLQAANQAVKALTGTEQERNVENKSGKGGGGNSCRNVGKRK